MLYIVSLILYIVSITILLYTIFMHTNIFLINIYKFLLIFIDYSKKSQILITFFQGIHPILLIFRHLSLLLTSIFSTPPLYPNK